MHSPHTSYRWRRERVIETIKCMLSPHTSYRWRGERVIEPIKCMHSPHTSYRWRRERVIELIKCMLSPHTSYRWIGERVIETIKCMLSPHTSYRWRGERDIETIKCMLSPHTNYRWRGERVIEPIKCQCQWGEFVKTLKNWTILVHYCHFVSWWTPRIVCYCVSDIEHWACRVPSKAECRYFALWFLNISLTSISWMEVDYSPSNVNTDQAVTVLCAGRSVSNHISRLMWLFLKADSCIPAALNTTHATARVYRLLSSL